MIPMPYHFGIGADSIEAKSFAFINPVIQQAEKGQASRNEYSTNSALLLSSSTLQSLPFLERVHVSSNKHDSQHDIISKK